MAIATLGDIQAVTVGRVRGCPAASAASASDSAEWHWRQSQSKSRVKATVGLVTQTHSEITVTPSHDYRVTSRRRYLSGPGHHDRYQLSLSDLIPWPPGWTHWQPGRRAAATEAAGGLGRREAAAGRCGATGPRPGCAYWQFEGMCRCLSP